MKDLILDYCRSHRVEIALTVISCAGTLLAIGALYVSYSGATEPIRVDQTSPEAEEVAPVTPPPPNRSGPIYVDVSGAVRSPGMVQLKEGDRLSDALERVGGLSVTADTDFFARNYNMSRIVSDQEKIHVPRIDEVIQGIFVEGRYLINHSMERLADAPAESGGGTATQISNSNSGGKININTASESELDALPGVGPATVKKIVDNRPYASVEELLEKKSVGQSVYGNISSLIVAQ